MKSFSCLSIVPINVSHVNLAIASIRAGGIGILDREFCQKNELDLAEKNLQKLIVSVAERERIGLRLHTNQIEESKNLLALLSPEPHWLILCGWEIENLSQALKKLTITEKSNLLLEVLSIEQAQQIESLKLPIQGIVAKGHESGGWVSEDSAFILSQKILKQASLPVYIQGGIGINTAAACRAAGAEGVVLDDQLWLMPESPLKPEYQQWLKALNGQEAIIIGERLNASCRVLSRPGFSSVSALQELAKTIEIAKNSPETNSQNWQEQAPNWIGWEDPKKTAWPMGQSIGMAAAIRDKYKITNKFIQAILTVTHQQIETAQLLKPLQPDGPLAVSHRTKYPIVQGPMTRVSDQATFAQAVAAGGGLPMLALALMGGGQVKTLLKETQQLLKDQSWGIGILGFVPQSLRKEQLEVVLEIKPPFALIAGGRPDQAAHLEAQGIATYLHVPTPTLLKMFLQQGARRFVFEGRECGGHVGPLSSFILWETMIETLLNEAPSGAESDIHVLLPGGFMMPTQP